MEPTTALPDMTQSQTLPDLITATNQTSDGVASIPTSLAAETLLLQHAQAVSFPEELKPLKAGREVAKDSRLLSLAPEYDRILGVIRVGGRLRQAEVLDPDTIHPIILDSRHPSTRLLIKSYDERLLHPGPERVYGEMRQKYWILGGRGAIRKHRYACVECQRWRARATVPKMADLPPARLRLLKPPFWSTGVDCFGPLTIKLGRRVEKRWGILFKCLTTRCVHLDLLESLDTEAFLMALRRFISRRGKPYEILADRGTSFKAEARLEEAFQAMEPSLQDQLMAQQISFKFNPPGAPHFGGTWEREIKSVKTALRVVLGDQTVTETVLRTVLIEVEGILNSKPLGYLSADVADPDPVTPNMPLMGRRDASLPQAMYADTNLVGRRRWRHSQILADHFWARFIRDYLPSLQHRGKWRREMASLETGQVVMMVDPQLPRASWPVGRITKIMPGTDGRVRSVEIQVKNRTYIRPVARLIPLPEMTEDGEQ
eukprot:XP_014068408.1 PREDICTED: uncharacterized protein LOC106612089 [Salmo salar]